MRVDAQVHFLRAYPLQQTARRPAVRVGSAWPQACSICLTQQVSCLHCGSRLHPWQMPLCLHACVLMPFLNGLHAVRGSLQLSTFAGSHLWSHLLLQNFQAVINTLAALAAALCAMDTSVAGPQAVLMPLGPEAEAHQNFAERVAKHLGVAVALPSER